MNLQKLHTCQLGLNHFEGPSENHIFNSTSNGSNDTGYTATHVVGTNNRAADINIPLDSINTEFENSANLNYCDTASWDQGGNNNDAGIGQLWQSGEYNNTEIPFKNISVGWGTNGVKETVYNNPKTFEEIQNFEADLGKSLWGTNKGGTSTACQTSGVVKTVYNNTEAFEENRNFEAYPVTSLWGLNMEGTSTACQTSGDVQNCFLNDKSWLEAGNLQDNEHTHPGQSMEVNNTEWTSGYVNNGFLNRQSWWEVGNNQATNNTNLGSINVNEVGDNDEEVMKFFSCANSLDKAQIKDHAEFSSKVGTLNSIGLFGSVITEGHEGGDLFSSIDHLLSSDVGSLPSVNNAIRYGGEHEFAEGQHVDMEKTKKNSLNVNNNAMCSSLVTSNGLHKCSVCGKTYANKRSLQRHGNVHTNNKSITCNMCEKNFKNPQILAYHVKTLHSEKGGFECKICHKRFNEIQKFEWHSFCHVKDDFQKKHELHEKTTSLGKFNTPIFKTENYPDNPYKNIMIEYQGEKRYFYCNVCESYFESKYNVQYHSVCSGSINHSRIKCVFCDKQFRYQYHYLAHMRSHIMEKQFFCKTCGNEFTTKRASLRHSASHMLRHENDSPVVKRFLCDYCPRLFRSEFSLRQHLVEHNKKPFPCEKCNKSFQRSSSLVRHNRNAHNM